MDVFSQVSSLSLRYCLLTPRFIWSRISSHPIDHTKLPENLIAQLRGKNGLFQALKTSPQELSGCLCLSHQLKVHCNYNQRPYHESFFFKFKHCSLRFATIFLCCTATFVQRLRRRNGGGQSRCARCIPRSEWPDPLRRVGEYGRDRINSCTSV